MGDSARVIGPMVCASTWRELAEFGERHPGAPAIVDATEHTNGLPADDARQAVHWDWSDTPFICYGRPGSPDHSPTHPKLTFAAKVPRSGADKTTALDAAILQSIDVRRVNHLLERVGPNTHPLARQLLRHALHRSLGTSTVLETADRFAMPTRSLYRRCAKLGIPGPGVILSMARIFTVEHLADWSGQPTGVVALALGFSHRANYRRLVRRRVGVPPSVIRERGGADYVEEVIVRQLVYRAAAVTPSPPLHPTIRSRRPSASASSESRNALHAPSSRRATSSDLQSIAAVHRCP